MDKKIWLSEKSELEKLSNCEDYLSHLLSDVLSVGEGSWYPLDLVVIGIVKRSLNIASAFKTLVISRNMLCARAILRMELDTVIRFSAFWLSDDPDEMAMDVMRGKRIDKIKDRNGHKMNDAYLVSELSGKFSWMPKVYESTSGYIHFSEAHIFASATKINEDGTVEFLINNRDDNFPEFSWNEIVNCFNECTEILKHYLTMYKNTKGSL